MKNNLIKISIYSLPVAILFAFIACVPTPEYSNVPAITLHSTVKTRVIGGDSINIGLDFQDGDGDLGLASTDTLAPFQEYTNITKTVKNPYYNNYWLDMYRKSKGKWYKIQFSQGYSLNGRYPKLFQDGRSGPLKGILYYGTKISDISSIVGKKDTIMFKVQIVDRALNLSNIIETDAVVLSLK